MFILKIKSYFSSAHFLRNYNGKCENIHGHNWKVELEVSGKKQDSIGLVIDFKELKNKLNKVLDTLDHKCINDVPYFRKINPSCENISKYIFDFCSKKINTKNIKVFSVTVWETETASVRYEV